MLPLARFSKAAVNLHDSASEFFSPMSTWPAPDFYQRDHARPQFFSLLRARVTVTTQRPRPRPSQLHRSPGQAYRFSHAQGHGLHVRPICKDSSGTSERWGINHAHRSPHRGQALVSPKLIHNAQPPRGAACTNLTRSTHRLWQAGWKWNKERVSINRIHSENGQPRYTPQNISGWFPVRRSRAPPGRACSTCS